MSMGAHAAFMRKKGDHEMQSAGGALQLMACRVRVVRIAYMIEQPKIHVELAERSRPLQGSASEKGEQAQDHA